MPVSSSPSVPTSSHFDAEAALHALDDALYVVGTDWRILFVNRAVERTLGVRAADCLGRDLRDAFPAGGGKVSAELIRATMADGRTRSERVAYRDARASALYDATVSAMPSGGVAIQLRDVSRFAHIEHELAERSRENELIREIARALLEQTDATALLDMLCREAMQRCDADGATVVETRDGDAVITAAVGVTEPTRHKRFAVAGSLTARAAAARAPVSCADYARDYAAQARELGAELVGPMLLAPLLAMGRMLGALGVARRRQSAPFGSREEHRLRAIADQAALAVWKQRLVEDAQQANRAKGEFIATISHEFRTPLAAVAGYEELLADQILGPLTERQLGALDRMRASIQHLSAIIEEILTFSRLEAGEEEVSVQRATAQDILMAAAAVLEPLAREKGLALAVSGPPARAELETDATMIRRILVNLGANAVKFTERGSVGLEAEVRGNDVAFTVRDTGIGIAPENVSQLFAPFVQLESGFTRRFSGAGLGLYVSQRLARLLRGRIEVDSEVGKGSAFTLVVPVKCTDRGPGTGDERRDRGSAGK